MPPTLIPLPSEVDRAFLADSCRRSLSTFFQRFWSVVEPGTQLVWNWHLTAICDHLQAVTDGRIRKLLICVPPGHAKSISVSVMWQPWQWLEKPWLRELYGSYDERLTHRDSVKAKDIIKSNRYRNIFKPDWRIRRDVDSKGEFSNTASGGRKTYYMGSRKKTGWRGDHVVVDDSLSAEDRYNKIEKAAVIDSWDKVLSTRVNRPEYSGFVAVAQRLAEDDLIGHIIQKYGDEYVYLMLPTYFVPTRRCKTPIFTDPRTKERELLFPALYPQESISSLEVALGRIDFEAQHQHNPVPSAGERFELAKMQFWRYPIKGDYRTIELKRRTGAVDQYQVDRLSKFVVADLAASEKTENDYTVIGLWAITPRNELILLHRVKIQSAEPGIIQALRDVYNINQWGRVPPMWVGLESSGLGLPIAQNAQDDGLPIIYINVHEDLKVRTATAIVRIDNGSVFFPDPDIAPWMLDFLHFVILFPGATHDDDVSMLSLAANSLFNEKPVIINGHSTIGPIKTTADVNRMRSDATKHSLFGRN